MINHPGRSQSTFRPKFRPAHRDWGYVAHGLDTGLHFVRDDLGYPPPYWSSGETRVRLDINGHSERIWIVEAKVASGQTIPETCRMPSAKERQGD